MKTSTFLGSVLCALSLFAIGCGSDYTLEVIDQTDPPVAADISGQSFEIAVGIAVGFTAVPKENGDEVDDKKEIRFTSDDADVVGIASTTEDRRFVVWGVHPGDTTIAMEVDGRAELVIPVTVKAQ